MKRGSRRGHKPGAKPETAAAGTAILEPIPPLPEPVSAPAAPSAEAPEPRHPSEPGAAQEPAADRVAGLEGESHLIVSLGGPLYAIPIIGIEQILPMRPVAPLPRSSAVVRGVLFLRGQPVSVIDLAMLLGLPAVRARRIVVLVIESERYGLVVEEVLKVAPPGSLRDLSAPPATLEVHPAVRAVARLRDEIVSLLDPERLVPAAGPRPAA